MANGEISVSVEKAAHDALRDLAQRLADEHGLMVEWANFRWTSAGTIARPREIVIEVEATMRSTA